MVIPVVLEALASGSSPAAWLYLPADGRQLPAALCSDFHKCLDAEDNLNDDADQRSPSRPFSSHGPKKALRSVAGRNRRVRISRRLDLRWRTPPSRQLDPPSWRPANGMAGGGPM